MQAGEVGASNSDILTDKEDDDVTHMTGRCVKPQMCVTCVLCDETLT